MPEAAIAVGGVLGAKSHCAETLSSVGRVKLTVVVRTARSHFQLASQVWRVRLTEASAERTRRGTLGRSASPAPRIRTLQILRSNLASQGRAINATFPPGSSERHSCPDLMEN